MNWRIILIQRVHDGFQIWSSYQQIKRMKLRVLLVATIRALGRMRNPQGEHWPEPYRLPYIPLNIRTTLPRIFVEY